MKIVAKSLTSICIAMAVIFFTQCLETEVLDTNFYNSEGTFLDEDKSSFPNPERGWYRSMETQNASVSALRDYKKSNVTLVAFETNLSKYLDRPLDQSKLNEVDNAFSYARSVGLSVIYRAAYDFSGRTNPEPRDIAIITGHIRQLSPIFYKYEDIFFNIQAGFLGPWGEWHSSLYGTGKNDPVKPEYQRIVVNALLEAVPKSVTIALRRPEYIRNIADETKRGNDRGDHLPVTRNEAFGSSAIARLAFHNDALMSEETDMDTYVAPNYPRETELNWVNKHTRYTPMVAETNKVSGYNDAKRAVELLDRINIHSINIEYHPDVLKKWKNSKLDNGMTAYDYIDMMMGYRFVLKNLNIPEKAQSGGTFQLKLELSNTGFGHLLREKKFEIVLKNGGKMYRTGINEDVRFWNKNELISRTYNFQLPSGMNEGDWDVYLGLSSTFGNLASNPSYSVRFSNKKVWDAELGLNRIGMTFISLGPSSGGAKEFVQIQP